jgi:hypothetical protein
MRCTRCSSTAAAIFSRARCSSARAQLFFQCGGDSGLRLRGRLGQIFQAPQRKIDAFGLQRGGGFGELRGL